ncbi:MAG: SigB/SigF/SigG family RNA polymerase sigma factor [Clostridia bacterium]|nr:SigB/SigF/SigG family RNA polymerase sigma factor [Clostridia bacterium]
MEEYKPIDLSQTNELVKKAKNGDSEATNILINGNFPLIKSIVKGYLNKGVEYDDLYQIGCVGFLKAIKNFKENFDVKFSTYAVPMIAGEIKRFLRDDGSIKVSRSIKTLLIKAKAFIEKQRTKTGETPTITDIAKEFNVEEADVIIALDSGQQLISLHAKVDEDNPNSQNIIDKIAVFDKSDEMLDKIILKNAILELEEKDRKIILLRYYRGKTQGEVAEMLGISQVQVSRMETKIISQLKNKLIEK